MKSLERSNYMLGAKSVVVRLVCGFLLLVTLFCRPGWGAPTVLNFDDLDVLRGIHTYSGVTFDSYPSEAFNDYPSPPWAVLGSGDECWYVYSGNSYSTPHSGDNFILNGYGVDSGGIYGQPFGFHFPVATTFYGAWFAGAPGSNAPTSQVRFVGYSDDAGTQQIAITNWFGLVDGQSRWLDADFDQVKYVTVQRASTNWPYPYPAWYTMDDLTFEGVWDTTVPPTYCCEMTGIYFSSPNVPDPASLTLALLGLGTVGVLRWRIG